MSEMKNIVDGINDRFDIVKETISGLADVAIENIQNETERKKVLKRKKQNIN